MMELNLHLLV